MRPLGTAELPSSQGTFPDSLLSTRAGKSSQGVSRRRGPILYESLVGRYVNCLTAETDTRTPAFAITGRALPRIPAAWRGSECGNRRSPSSSSGRSPSRFDPRDDRAEAKTTLTLEDDWDDDRGFVPWVMKRGGGDRVRGCAGLSRFNPLGDGAGAETDLLAATGELSWVFQSPR
jgi:hypothetical protein